MKPTIGRIVHYRDLGGQVRAAIITKVWSDDCVGLTVFYPRDEKPLYADTEIGTCLMGTESYRWSWPERT